MLFRSFILGSGKEWGTKQLSDYVSANPYLSSFYTNSFDVSSTCAAPDGWLTTDAKYPDPYTTYRGWGGGAAPKMGNAMVAFSNCDVNNEIDILYHEVFHAVQWVNSYITAPFLGNQSWGTSAIASWLVEGQAEYFGLLLKEDFKWNGFSLDVANLVESNLPQQWIADYAYLNGYSPNNANYFLGGLMYEYLLAKYGLQKTLSIHDETTKLGKIGDVNQSTRYIPFETAFQTTFGQSMSSFYEEVKPYVQWRIDHPKPH